MLTDKELNIVRRFIENKTHTFKGELLYQVPKESEFDFKIDLKGYRKMISVGEYYDYLIVGVTVTKLKDPVSELLMGNKYGDHAEVFKKNLYFLYNKLNSYIYDLLSYFDPNIRITIDEFKIMTDNNDISNDLGVNENNVPNNINVSNLAIRTVVKDILKILKNNKPGQHILPNNGNYDEYIFKNLPFSFSVELNLFQDVNINTFIVDGNWFGDEDVIEIIISYNPKNLRGNLYEIVGELNDVICHELTHGKQGVIENMSEINENLDPFQYYTQPREIEAQKAGFKRVSKLKRTPYLNIVKEWFNNHRDVHNLKESEVKEVIRLLL